LKRLILPPCTYHVIPEIIWDDEDASIMAELEFTNKLKVCAK
jgi:hypothetical protein